MSKNIGTLVGAPIRINDSNDTYPSAYSSEIKGGKRVVSNLTDLYLLVNKPDQLEENVTVVTVLNDGFGKFEYKLINITNAGNYLGWEKQRNINDILPLGLKNQTIFVNNDNSFEYHVGDEVEIGQFIKTDDELDRAKTRGSTTQEDIFNKFKRFSHGGSQTNPFAAEINNYIPGQPSQLSSWSYDSGTGNISTTLNTGSIIGFISENGDKFDRYISTATLTSSAPDNDRVGLVLAFIEDLNDLVPNRAYGMTGLPDGVDTTSQFIPNQHSLVLFRDRNGSTLSYVIYYDFSKTTQKVVADGSNLSGLFSTTNNYNGVDVDLKVERIDDIFTCYTSQFSDAPSGKGSLAFPLVLDLNSDNDLLKFKGKQSYGYAVHSQANTSYSNITFSGSSNVIYDLRNGDVWIFTSSGFIIDTTRNYFDEIGIRRELYNPYEDNLLYIGDDKSIYLLNTKSNVTGLITDGNNGITKNNTILKLGGDIFENTILNLVDDGVITIGDYDNKSFFQVYPVDHSISLRTQGSYDPDTNPLVSSFKFVMNSNSTTNLLQLGAIVPGNNDFILVGLNIALDKFIFRDDYNLKGAVYLHNYFEVGSLDDRWIPDWAAVKSLVGDVVHKTGDESIGGIKTFTADSINLVNENSDASLILTNGGGVRTTINSGSVATNIFTTGRNGINLVDANNQNIVTFKNPGITASDLPYTLFKSPIVIDSTSDKGITVNWSDDSSIPDNGYIPKRYVTSQFNLRNEIDVFIIAGQSNALGSSTSPSTAEPIAYSNTAFQYYAGIISPGGEPWGASNGSAWNAFVNQYYKLTGRKILLVPTAAGSTAMVPAADTGAGNWDVTAGTLYTNSINQGDAAISAIATLGYKPKFKGVLWSQGETDGSYAGLIESDYITGLTNLINAYRTHYGVNSYFYIFRTGEFSDGSTPYKPVRLYQEKIANTVPFTQIVSREAVTYYNRGLMRPDGTHYLQPAYDIMGNIGATNVVKGDIYNPIRTEYNYGSINNFNSKLRSQWQVGQTNPIDLINGISFSDSFTSTTSTNGLSLEITNNITSSNAAQFRGSKIINSIILGSGVALTNPSGGVIGSFINNSFNSAGTITNLLGLYTVNNNTSTGTITNNFGGFIDNGINSGGGVVTNNTGLFIKGQSMGTNNTQLHIGSSVIAPPIGNWSIYNNSSNQEYSGVIRAQAFGTAIEFYNATYDTTNNSKYRLYWNSATQFNISAQISGTGVIGDLVLGNSAGSKYIKIQQTTLGTFGSVFTLDHGTTSGSNIISELTTGNFTAVGNQVWSKVIGPTVAMGGTGGWTGLIVSPLLSNVGSGSNFLARFGTNTATKATGTHTDLVTINTSGIVNISNLTASKLVFTDASKNLTSTGIGTSSQFIKGDGSLDSNVYAPLASPTFTGTPIAPTATVGTNTTQISTTAFTKGAIDALLAATNVWTGGLNTFNGGLRSNGQTDIYGSVTIRTDHSLAFYNTAGTGTLTLSTTPTGTNTQTFQDKTGVIALTTDISIGGTYTTSATAQSTFTVSIGSTLANVIYKIVASADNLLSAVAFYITNKTTSTFDIVVSSPLTGTVSFDWIIVK